MDLAQGLEWEGVVHVVASKIYGRGKFYVAITRAKALANLKVSGMFDAQDVRRVAKANWRALVWLHRMGEHVPEACLKAAMRSKAIHDAAWAWRRKSRVNEE